jgi:hypothetical protein
VRAALEVFLRWCIHNQASGARVRSTCPTPTPYPTAGLPAADIVSLAIDTRTLVETPPRNPQTPRVWIGTATGAILFDPSVDPADDVNAAGPALYYGAVRRQQRLPPSDAGVPLLIPHAQRWRFFLGPRYLPVSPADTLLTPVPARGIACVGNTTFLLSGTAGVGALTAELWTLARKASLMEELQVCPFRSYRMVMRVEGCRCVRMLRENARNRAR